MSRYWQDNSIKWARVAFMAPANGLQIAFRYVHAGGERVRKEIGRGSVLGVIEDVGRDTECSPQRADERARDGHHHIRPITADDSGEPPLTFEQLPPEMKEARPCLAEHLDRHAVELRELYQNVLVAARHPHRVPLLAKERRRVAEEVQVSGMLQIDEDLHGLAPAS